MDSWLLLLGVVLGSGSSILASWLTIRWKHGREREDAERNELRRILAEYWSAVDALWRAAEGVMTAVLDIMGNRDTQQDYEAAKFYEQRRLDALAARHTADVESSALLAQIRILYPALADTATALQEASRTIREQTYQADKDRRAIALAEFEVAARAALT